MTPQPTPTFSVVVPVYNERDNVGPLFGEIRAVMEWIGEPFEVVFVDDGSRDGTGERLAGLRAGDSRVRVVELDGNFGEAAALSAGFNSARGELVVTLDGDGQNDPADIPRLVGELRRRGLQVVSGLRRERQEGYWLRVLPSRVANALIARVTGVPIHDCGCGLKVYRRAVVSGAQLPRGMNRFLPAILGVKPDQVAELPTRDRRRESGTSHYGLERTFVVLRDLVALPFLVRSPRTAEVRFALATAAAAAAGAVVFDRSTALAVLFDSLAALAGLVWWNVRRFNRAREAGVYRVREELP